MTTIYEHSDNYLNPHQVTAEQVGLENLANLPTAINEAIDDPTASNYYIAQNQIRDMVDNKLLAMGLMDEDGRLNRTTPTQASLTPGAWELKGGDAIAGFYGEVYVDDFIQGDALAAAIGLTTGFPQNVTAPWLKFVIDDQVIFVAKKPYRYGVSWEDIYQAGAVYGTGNQGLNPAGGDRLQDALVEIHGVQYKVRLMKTAPDDPKVFETDTEDGSGTQGSEWNRLIYRVSSVDPLSQQGGNWATYTAGDLGLSETASYNGSYSWCLNTHAGVVEEGEFTERALRGGQSFSFVSSDNPDRSTNAVGWRPVLVPVVDPIDISDEY